MSEAKTYEVTVTGQYRPCKTCRAPVLVPFPASWTVGLRREGATTLITPHRPDCERPRR